MKKYFLLFFLLCYFSHLSAQINIQSFPVAGDTVIFSAYNSPSQPMLLSVFDQTGINFTWDFSNWGISGYDTLIFDEPQGNLFADRFPSAELAILGKVQNQSEFFPYSKFIQLTSTEVNVAGNVLLVNNINNALIPQFITNNETLFSFPINSGNSYSDTLIFVAKTLGSSLGMPFDSIMQKSTVYRYDTIDGTGQLQVSGYAYGNLYRNKIVDQKTDSVFGYTQQTGWEFLEVKYRDFVNIFWLNENDFFVAWMEAKGDTVTSIKVKKYNPTVRLELVDFPNEGIENQVLAAFEVRAYNIIDNSLATDFNDVVSIVRNNGYSSATIIGGLGQAVSGIVSFNNVYFTSAGSFEVLAVSDTTESPSMSTITIHPGPDSLAIVNLVSTPEGQLLSPVEVHLFNSLRVHDLLYTGNVSLGKLSGGGKIAGTLTKPIINGIATFDNISFNHQDLYNVVAWLPALDTSILDSEYVNITSNPDLQWISIGADTLSEYVDRASFFGWIGGQDGYLSGSSRQWYDHVGQHYTFSSKGLLSKVIFYFANRLPDFQITNDTYKVRVYDAGVLLQNPSPFNIGLINDSLPIGLLGEQSFSYTDVHPTDFFIQTPSVIMFDTPIQLYSDFIVALEVNNSQTTDDTLIIWTSMPGEGMLENRSLRHTINYTNPNMAEGWVRDLDWRPEYDRDNMIMPVIEVDTMDIVTSSKPNSIQNVNIYPNPSSGKVIIQSTEFIQQIDIFDFSGRLVSSSAFKLTQETKAVLDLENLSNGLYTAEISFSNSSSVKEKLVILKP